jgi:hypothetical protein
MSGLAKHMFSGARAHARELQEAITFQAMGTIVRVEGQIFVVRTDEGDYRCRRAVSCLVEPELHDFVLAGVHVSAQKSETAYVLAVLERESPDATVACEGNLDLKVKSGKLRMASAEGIDLVSSKHVQIAATDFSVHASTAKVVAQEILAFGADMIGELATIKLKGGVLDKVFERVSERVQRSFRRVEEIDQLKAKQLDYVTEETMSLRSENMVATAKELVKVDGEQIHFG